jgi:hypothetical protein
LPASLWLRPEEAELSPEQAMWVNKLVLACVDSLLLLIGQYHYSYQERGKRFQEKWSAVASLLKPDQDWFRRAAQEATAFKLSPTDTKPPYINVPGFWDDLLEHAARSLGVYHYSTALLRCAGSHY